MDSRELQARVKAIACLATTNHGSAVNAIGSLDDGSVQLLLSSAPRAVEVRRALDDAGFVVEDYGRALRARPSVERLLHVADAARAEADAIVRAAADTAQAAIDLFVDYRDHYAYGDQEATTLAVDEAVAAVQGSGDIAHWALNWYLGQRDVLRQLTGRLFRELRRNAPATAHQFTADLTEDEDLALWAAVEAVSGDERTTGGHHPPDRQPGCV